MQFKIDENLPPALAEPFAAAGHDAHTVFEEQLGGAKDEELWARVLAERRVLLTQDLGFADVRVLRNTPHAGVIVFRLAHYTAARLIALATPKLLELGQIDLANRLVVISEHAIRITPTQGKRA